jgi:TIR domain
LGQLKHPYACFVSYRHREGEREAARIERFFADLELVLRRRSEDHMKVFYDQARIQPGFKFDETIANSLCRSFCMIALWTADYFSRSHDYCIREYCAMEALEAKRLSALGSEHRDMGLIIPVICCDKDLFPSNTVKRQYVDFSDHFLAGFNSERYERAVERLARDVLDRCEAFLKYSIDLADDCTNYRLPASEAIQARIASLVPERVGQFDRLFGRL